MVEKHLTGEELAKWDEEHRKLLDEIAPEQFDVLHYAALAVLKKKQLTEDNATIDKADTET